MSDTPFARAESLRVGTIDYVSPDEVKALLDIEAPDGVALNTGGLRPFPRVHGYVLMPLEDGYLVGQVEWLTIERSAFPKRRGVQDFGVVDLPYPLRRMSLVLLGTLRKLASDRDEYLFGRGVHALPSVGEAVLLPTEVQLRAVVESGENRRVRIGHSPFASNAHVRVDPDRLFGRHLAVLGNTGSGKSCSVAGLIRWCLEEARRQRPGAQGAANARFVVLDPNGEYSRAFSGTVEGIRVKQFKVGGAGELGLRVPLWLWNSAEWAAFSQASPKTQRPLLKRALREVKAGRGVAVSAQEERKLSARRYITSTLVAIGRDVRSGAIKTEATKFGRLIEAVGADVARRLVDVPGNGLEETRDAAQALLDRNRETFSKDGKTIEFFRPFTEGQVAALETALENAASTLGGLIPQEGPDEDTPVPFVGSDLADHLEMLAAQETQSQYVDFLVARIRMLLSDPRIRSVIDDNQGMTLEGWLSNHICDSRTTDGQVTILDLSLVPTEIVHVVTAVAARLLFEAMQRYRRLYGTSLPTVLVMEEAHTFIRQYKEDGETYDGAAMCCQVFEKIAREGRKFGIGLVLSSQRPSELSQTVLSQCNTYILHRITNDRDQELVQRLVPDNLRGLLRELPSLPSQHGILLGWASELPVLVRMDDLPRNQQPHSEDPDFWDVWTSNERDGTRLAPAWAELAADWQRTAAAVPTEKAAVEALPPPSGGHAVDPPTGT